MNFNPMAFVDNLYYMGVGMAAILIVIGVIIVLVSALQKMSDKISEKKTDGGAQ